MAKQTPTLIKTFGADATVTAPNVCVVMSGTTAGNVGLPAGANAIKFVGVTAEPATNGAVAVQVAGIVQIVSDGSAPIAAGDYVVIGNTSGQVRATLPASGTIVRQIVGIAVSSVPNTTGALVDVLLQPSVYIGV